MLFVGGALNSCSVEPVARYLIRAKGAVSYQPGATPSRAFGAKHMCGSTQSAHSTGICLAYSANVSLSPQGTSGGRGGGSRDSPDYGASSPRPSPPTAEEGKESTCLEVTRKVLPASCRQIVQARIVPLCRQHAKQILGETPIAATGRVSLPFSIASCRLRGCELRATR